MIVFIAQNYDAKLLGIFTLLNSIVLVSTLPISSGLCNLLTREVSYNLSKGLDRELKGIIIYSIICSFIVLPIVAIVIYFCSNLFGEINIKDVYIYIIFSIFLRAIANILSSISNGFGEYGNSTLPLAIYLPLTQLICFSFMYYTETVVSVLIISQIVLFSYFVVFIFNIKIVFRLFFKLSNIDSPIFKKSWRSAILPLSIISILSTFSNEIITLLLASDVKELGEYRLLMQFYMIYMLMSTSINTVAYREISKYQTNEIKKIFFQFKRATLLNFFMASSLSLIIYVFGEDIIMLLYGENYVHLSMYLNAILLIQVLLSLIGPVGVTLNALKQEKTVMTMMLFIGFFTIFSSLYLIPNYGLIAAISILLLSRLITNIIAGLILFLKYGFFSLINRG
jgi:O-antigen/teichoic acid export membrane protein